MLLLLLLLLLLRLLRLLLLLLQCACREDEPPDCPPQHQLQ
jgi:hypothetical protein